MNTKITLLPQIQDSLIQIGEILGRIKLLPSTKPTPKLRRESKIRTIFATTKIEGNKLDLNEVTAVINGKKIIGKNHDVKEVENAIALYDLIHSLNCESEDDYLIAHKVLMKDLIKNAGKYRKVNVGIKSSKGDKVKMVFPEHENVKNLCRDMFDYISTSKDNSLIKSCIIHYLSVSIHPFEDGNGRLSRFWQSLFLSKNFEIFEFIPLESFIRSSQEDYYDYLNISQKSDDPTGFVHFMLKVICESLSESLSYSYEKVDTTKMENRLIKAKENFKNQSFARKDYLTLNAPLSESMATKDLRYAVNKGILNRSGLGNGAKYYF